MLGFSACKKDATDPTGSNDGPTQFNILLTDAPIDLDEVNIDIQSVTIKGDGGTDFIDIGANAGIYNLLDFQNGATTLIGAAELTVETITDIRLILGENNTVVKDGEIHDLRTPSAQQSGLKLKVCIPIANVPDYDLTLDFDACESVFQTGNGQYVLKPRIKILNPDAICEGDDDGDGDDDDEEEEDDDDEEEEEEEEEEDDDDDDSDDDDDEIMIDSLPQPILDYLATNYPDALIEEVELLELCDDLSYYVVEVETDNGDMLLYFDEDGNPVQSGTQIHNDDLPQAVLDGIAAEYPNGNIVGNWSFEITSANGDMMYLVKLNGNTKLLVAADGTIICEL